MPFSFMNLFTFRKSPGNVKATIMKSIPEKTVSFLPRGQKLCFRYHVRTKHCFLGIPSVASPRNYSHKLWCIYDKWGIGYLDFFRLYSASLVGAYYFHPPPKKKTHVPYLCYMINFKIIRAL